MRNQYLRVFILAVLLSAAVFSQAFAEANFDFGLPLFGFEEIRFEKSKPSDFNIHLLKKYIIENEGSIIQQLHGINRWFSLLRLSDTPRRNELIKYSNSFFSNAGKKSVSSEEKLREVFYFGLLLSQDREPDADSKKDQKYEDLLIEAEEQLVENGDYWLIKGIVFHLLRERPNDYFSPMKPEEDLKRALALISRTAHRYYVMGQAFRFLGNMDSSLFLSIACYERASNMDPRNHKLQNSLLGIYMGLHENYQNAGKQEPFWLEEAVYKKILAISPHNPHALNNLGFLYAEYGVNTKQAQELCQRAVDISPNNAGFHDSLGWAAFKDRDYPKAEEALKQSLSMKGNVYETYYHLGTLYYAIGQLEEAARYYEQAIAIKPDAVEALNNLAYLYTEQNRKIPEALAMARTAVRLEPSNASYLDTLGWCYYRMGELDAALSQLLKAAQIAPGQGEILLHIGRVYLDQNDFEHALTYLKEAHKTDPLLKDPDNSLYVAIRLKCYHRALADYHSIFKANADPNKINNILMGIARMYQEEKLYDKAIEITKLCSEIKNKEKLLDKPLFSSYGFDSQEAPKVTLEKQADETEETNTDDAAETPTEEPDEELADQNQAMPEKAGEQMGEDLEEALFSGLPPVTGHPLALSFGPVFFEHLWAYLPGMKGFNGKSVTVFIKTFRQLRKTAVFRIDSCDTTGKTMLKLASEFFCQLGGKLEADKNEITVKVRFGTKRQIFMQADGNSLYVSAGSFSEKAVIDLLKPVLKYDRTRFAAIIYDWSALSGLLPEYVQPFIANPFLPFARIYTRYTYKNGNLNEFSTATTGETIDDAFMRKFARELFGFKMFTRKMGIESTIKVRYDNDIIYISTDFEQIDSFVEKRLQKINPVLTGFILRYLSHTRCFLNRMFYSPDQTGTCPDGGLIEVDPRTGLVTCANHVLAPAIAVFLNPADACQFNRKRLDNILRNSKVTDLTTEDLEKLAAEIGIPLCPTSGKWSKKDGNPLKCSQHEN